MQDSLTDAIRPYTKAVTWTSRAAGECVLSGHTEAAVKLYAVQAALVKLAALLARGDVQLAV